METDKKIHNKLAKGKKIYTTQLPVELIDELKAFSEEVSVPMTLLVEKYLMHGLAKSKRTNTIPLTADAEE